WLERLASNAATGLDLFPWRSDGLNAPYWLGRAMSQMWMDVAWRPALTQLEKRVHRDVLNCLSKAHALDPKAAYPWREWEELLRHSGNDDPLSGEVSRRAAAEAGPRLIGYRRRRMRLNLHT